LTENQNTTKKESLSQTIFEWVETFCLALLGVVVVFTFICRFVTVDGESMMQTLHHGDRLIISNLFYTPKTGDIVVVQDVEEQLFQGPVIKRVIATEGETVEIDNNTWEIKVTHLDGTVEILDEPYAFHKYPGFPMTSFDIPPHVVADGCVFVLGDNRQNSLDSRYVGDIDKRKILGKAYLRLFPFTDISFLG